MRLPEPRWLGPCLALAGFLMGAFAGQLPQHWQMLGLSIGVVLGIIGIADIVMRWVLNRDRKPAYRPGTLLADTDLGPKAPDLSAWAALEEIALGDAAFLWCGRVPQEDFKNDPEAKLVLEKLKLAAVRAELDVGLTPMERVALKMERESGYRIDGSTSTIARVDDARRRAPTASLRKYAERIGERPRFLFPEG